MATKQSPRRRTRGTISSLPSGALRVRVYAGTDPVTSKDRYLRETVPAGPKAAAEAEKVRTRLLGEVDAGRQPMTSAMAGQLMARYLEVLHVEVSTRANYEAVIRTHIEPLLGDVPLGRVRGQVLDSFHAQLRACRRSRRRSACRGDRQVVPRTELAGEC